MVKFSFLLLLVFSLAACGGEAKEKKKILFIATNVDAMNEQPNGTYLVEIAVPFAEFTNNGYGIDVMSPKGGMIPIYHNGDTSEVVKETVASALFIQKTNNSRRPSEINEADYEAVVIPGGYGQFWDTQTNQDVLRKIAAIYEGGGIIGTLGHGTATLIDVKLASGEYFVKDKTMVCFPSAQEKSYMEQSKFGKLLPYDMEEELHKRGADLRIYDPETRTNFQIVDSENRLVTASFATGGQFVAKEVLRLIQ